MNDIKKNKISNNPVYGIVYKVTNMINEKVYIGVSTLIEDGLDNAFNKRYNNNILNTHNEHLKNAIKKYGIENFDINPVIDIAYSQKELDELENLYILKYNSMNRDFGYNKRGGGSGGRLSDETKKKMSDIWTDEYKQNHSKKIKLKWSEPEYREHMSEILKERWQNEEYREYMCNMSKELWNDETHRSRIIKSIKERWQDEEYKNYMNNLLKERWQNEEYKQNYSNKIKAKWEEPEYRNAVTLAVKSRWDSDEYREKMRNMSKELSQREDIKENFVSTMKDYWSKEENKKAQSERSKSRWQNEEYRKNQSEERKARWENDEYRNAQVAERKARWENDEYRERMSKRRSGGGNARAIKVSVKVNGEYRDFGCKKEAFTSIGVSKDVFNMSIKLGLTPKILKAGVTEIIIDGKVIDYTSRDKPKDK